MKKSDVSSSAELFSGSATSAKCESTSLSLFVSHSQEEATPCNVRHPCSARLPWSPGARTIHRATWMRRECGFPRKKGHDLEYVWLADEVHEWHSGRRCSLARARCAWILEEHGLVRSLSNPSLLAHVERDIRLLAHGDEFMVEMLTHEEKWFESVLVLEIRWKVHGEVPIRMATRRWKPRS